MINSNVSGTVFRDFTLLLVLAFVSMVVWLLPHIQPPAAENKDSPAPGNVIVAITWPEGDTDIDMWVMGPGEMRPVGYSNKSGLLFNLLRDDLGNVPDATAFNYENAYSRGVVAGEYVVNVHCYRCAVLPVPVDIEVSVDPSPEASRTLIATSRVELRANGAERTAVRFKLNKHGALVPDSLNSVFRPLREAKKETP